MGVKVDGLSAAETGKVLADTVREFTKNLGLPVMKSLNIAKDSLEAVAPQVLKDDCAHFIPKETDAATVLKLLHRTYLQ